MQFPILKVDSVQLSFDGRVILSDVALQCRPGQIIGLLGRNGCGKSSLLKIIFGTLKPQHKFISIDDQYIQKGYHNNHIAYLPQHSYLPRGIKINKLVKLMIDEQGFAEMEDSNIELLKRHANQKAEELSGGELRQIEMLMVLYNKADFILLDEPFTHISPVQSEGFKRLLRERSKTKGVIITDHYYRDVLEVSDKLIVLNNGNTKHINSVDELVTYGYISSI